MNTAGPDIVKLATDTTLRISKLPTAREQTAALRRHIEASDVFVGVVREGDGEHRVLVKGRRVLEDIVASGRPRTVVQGAIFVSCAEEAIAMRHVFGDGEEMPEAPTMDCIH